MIPKQSEGQKWYEALIGLREANNRTRSIWQELTTANHLWLALEFLLLKNELPSDIDTLGQWFRGCADVSGIPGQDQCRIRGELIVTAALKVAKRGGDGTPSPDYISHYMNSLAVLSHAADISGPVRVPVAAVPTKAGNTDEEDAKTSRITWLELMAMPSDRKNSGAIQHPGDLTAGKMTGVFCDSLSLAFNAAHRIACADDKLLGVWRLLDSSGQPVALRATGTSAGGAALLGWYRLLAGKKVDGRVLVMAAVTQGSNSAKVLGPVEGVDYKAAAAKEAVRNQKAIIDTIATVREKSQPGKTHDCFTEAELAIGDFSDRIRVVELAGF